MSNDSNLFIIGDKKGVYSALTRIKGAFKLLGYLDVESNDNSKVSISFDQSNEFFGVTCNEGNSIQIFNQSNLEKISKIIIKNGYCHTIFFNDQFKDEVCLLTCSGTLEIYKIKENQT